MQPLELLRSSMQSLPSPLLEIPTELRLRIYHYAIESYGDFIFRDSRQYAVEVSTDPRAVVEYRSSNLSLTFCWCVSKSLANYSQTFTFLAKPYDHACPV